MAEMKDLLEPKYYTPEIAEFCEGFEFEYMPPIYLGKTNTNWIKEVFNIKRDNYWLLELLPLTAFRVKCLDQQDIQSLGFEIDSGYGYAKLYQREDCDIFTQNGKFFKVHSKNGSYEGNIRNLFHLKQILKDILSNE